MPELLFEQMKTLRLRGMANALEDGLTALSQKKLVRALAYQGYYGVRNLQKSRWGADYRAFAAPDSNGEPDSQGSATGDDLKHANCVKGNARPR